MNDINIIFKYLEKSNLSVLIYDKHINTDLLFGFISKIPNKYYISDIKKLNLESFTRNIKIDNLLDNRDMQIGRKYIIYNVERFCHADIDKIINDNFINAIDKNIYSILIIYSSASYSRKLLEMCNLIFNINENSIKIVKNRFGEMFDVDINDLKKYNNENNN